MNFLSAIVKKKKILLSIFLVVFVLGIIVPRISYAQPAGGFTYPTVESENGGTTSPFAPDATGTPECSWHSAKYIASAFTYAIVWVVFQFVSTISNWARGLLIWVISPGSNETCMACITNPAIKEGWPLVRDLANMFIVLGFVVVGIATALRLREYEAKKILPGLIIVALLVNFSLMICGIIVDGSNLAMNSFLRPSGYTYKIQSKIDSAQLDDIEISVENCDLGGVAVKSASIIIQHIVQIFAFFLMFFLFLARFVVLWLLVILSPLAFVLYVFPVTRKFAGMWWQQFLGWCFVGVPAGLCVYLADAVSSKINISQTAGAASSFPYLIPAALIFVGFFMSMKLAPIGASAVVGMGKAIGSFAMGTVVGGSLRGLANKTGIAGAAKKISGNALERVGLRPVGSTAQTAQKEMNETQSRVGSLDRSAETKVATGGAITATAVQNKVAAIKNKVKKGQIGDLGKTTAEQNKNIAFAESYEKGRGIESTTRKDAEKLNPELAKFNKEKVDEIMNQRGITSRNFAEQVALQESVQKLGPKEALKLEPQVLSKDVAFHMSGEQIKAYKRGSPAQRAQLKKHMGDIKSAGMAHRKSGNAQEFRRLKNIYDEIRRL